MQQLFRMGLVIALSCAAQAAVAQKDTTARTLSMSEYEHAKTLAIPDLDKDSYMKFENTYILDRNDYGKPYFITGDDGLRKRIDLYKLILKEGRTELGTVIYYTSETGRRYTACLPGFRADAKVWGKYFEDIHAIDREEKNFVLKLSYVLSKELGFQLYHASAAAQGKDLSKERESGTYGNDICFPGDRLVTLSNGQARPISEIRAGDVILGVDPRTQATTMTTVTGVTVHEVKNYAITSLLLLSAEERPTTHDITLHARRLESTPNHPMLTLAGPKRAGNVQEGDLMMGRDDRGAMHRYRVWVKTESADGARPVYNIVTGEGGALLIDGVVVSQK
ncbi:MAG: Hint domain-containing protein [Bacteroidota bacterium]|nr:Hint domain-containing protein [Bacteroidota bacterium]